MVLRSRRLIVVLLAIFTAAATILTVRVARRPATRLSSIHFVSADGRRLSGLFDGARRDPAAVARFAMNVSILEGGAALPELLSEVGTVLPGFEPVLR